MSSHREDDKQAGGASRLSIPFGNTNQLGVVRRFLRFALNLWEISRVSGKVSRHRVKRMKRGGLLLTIEGSRFHDTILTEEGIVSSHIARDSPGGGKDYLERSECDDAALDSILQRSVKCEVELSGRQWVFIWDRMVIFKLALALLLMNNERRSAITKKLEAVGFVDAQVMLIQMATGEMFGFRILSKLRLKNARKRGNHACVLNYGGKMHLGTIKEKTVVIAEMIGEEDFEGLAGIVKYDELMRHLILDEGHLLQVGPMTQEKFRKELEGEDSS